jgi:hypothetical protein
MADAIDHQIKRLDHLQGIIQRLAGNSFLIKGWTVTLVTAILGFALKDPDKTAPLAYMAFAPIILFWGLDGYYLAIERLIRHLYNDGADALRNAAYSSTAHTLPMPSIRPLPPTFADWKDATFARATWTIYVLLAICAGAVGVGLFMRVAKTFSITT